MTRFNLSGLLAIFMLLNSCVSVKRSYENDLQALFQSSEVSEKVLAKEDISHLPEPVQRHFEYCGFIGQSIPMSAELFEPTAISKWLRIKNG